MPGKTLKIFLSYAKEDEDMKTELDKALVVLKKSGKIAVWQDGLLLAGQEWDTTKKEELNTADIILLLVSADFNSSNEIWEKELSVAMERQAKKEARVIPVILRACDWQNMPYGKLQPLPAGGVPVSHSPNPDEAYTGIAKAIRDVVEYTLSR